MNTKLTLHLDKKLIAKAKRYSDQSGKSVSQIVADYFALIGAKPEEAAQLTPRVRLLIGSMKGTDVSEADYHRHLEHKAR